MESFSKDLFFTWQKNETTCGDDGMLFRIGKRKGRPAPPRRGHLFRLDALCSSRRHPIRGNPPPYFARRRNLFNRADHTPRAPGSTAQSGHISKPSVSCPQQAGGILRIPPCCLRPRTVSLRNGNGCGITSGIKRHFRLMNGTRKPILYAIGCFAGFYIL